MMLELLLALPAPDPSAPDPSGEPSPFGSLMPFILVLVVIMLFMPLFSRKERDRKKRLTALKKHDKVVTSGGIMGTIVNLDEHTVTLEISKDVRIRVKRSSVFDLERPPDPKAAAGEAKAGAKA